MYRIFLLIICVTISVPFIWSCTLFAHPTKKFEDGLEFLPLCSQVRKTQQTIDTYLKLKNQLPASPKNIFSGQTLFYFDAKPRLCRIFDVICGNGLGILFHELAPSSHNFT